MAVKRSFCELKIARPGQSFPEAIRMLEHYWRVIEFPAEPQRAATVAPSS